MKTVTIIKYDNSYCDLDGQRCLRGSKPECPKDTRGIEEICPHFHCKDKSES